MADLHLSRVAYGCSEYSQLVDRLDFLANGQGQFAISTRNKPKRAAELIGGRVYFIVKHMLMGCVEIVGFGESADGRTDIICALPLQRVRTTPKRAHQGWRYLTAEDAPGVMDENEAEDDLPPHLLRELAALKLI